MFPSAMLCRLLIAATVCASSLATHIDYTVVTGIFQQDDPATDDSTFNFTASNFGLIQRSYPSDSSCPQGKHSTQWQRLAHYISTLNAQRERSQRHVLLFLGRHGDGYHNAAESYFGTPAWNCYWAERDGNDTITWADAHLTSTGVDQANKVNAFWKHLISVDKIHPPQRYYTSPLYRCLQTANLTFSSLNLPESSPFLPTIKEFLREGISAHTCDRRSNKTYIHQHFHGFQFEKGFKEQDHYWKPMYAEPSPNQDARSKAVLNDIFSNDHSTYISMTSHGGEIGSIFRVLGHRDFALSTGSAIPVLVKAVTKAGEGPVTTTLPLTPQATCAAPPSIRDPSCNDCSCCVYSNKWTDLGVQPADNMHVMNSDSEIFIA